MISALRSAVVAKDIDAVRNLLANGASVNETDENGWTALMLAAKYNQPSIIRLLLESRADPEMYTSHGKAALHYALEKNHREAVLELLRGGANPHARAICNEFSLSPFSLWEYKDDLPLLVTAGAGQTAILHILLENGGSKPEPNFTSDPRRGALLKAAEGGHRDAVCLLLEHGADVNTWGTDDLTPLMLAAAIGATETMALLLDHGADPNARDFFGETALTLALQRDKRKAARLLIKRGADVNVVVAHDGSTPLTNAQGPKMLAIRLLLKKAGARV